MLLFLISCGGENEIEVYFCPEDDCEGELVALINSSEEEVLCAFYDLDLESVEDVLRDKEAEVIIDEDNHEHDFAHEYKSSGLMHNKFCVVDGLYVFTGSFNPTYNGAYRNRNNMVVVRSEKFADSYESYFYHLLEGTDYSTARVNAGENSLYNCFDSCAAVISDEIDDAERRVYFMTFSFTLNRLANDLILAHYRNVSIEGIFDSSQLSRYSVYDMLARQGIGVKEEGDKHKMHHKVFIIDNNTVMTGSYNPSRNAETRNKENVIVIEGPLAEIYAGKFQNT